MILYPTLELQNGRCVTLSKGNLDQARVWDVDPVETAIGFAKAGATWMHVTDFDAVAGTAGNDDLVAEIIRKVGLSVQLGGGLRSDDRIEYWIDRGAARIVVGTLAVRDPMAVKRLARQYPDQIVLAVDVWQGKVMADGWRHSSMFDPAEFIAEFADVPLAGILVTDIDSEIADTDASLGLISGLAEGSRTPVIASGIVRSLDDVARLKYVRNVAGAIVGRVLANGTVDLAEALAIAGQVAEPVAEFI